MEVKTPKNSMGNLNSMIIEDEMVAVEETIKIEEVELETAKIEDESFQHIKWEQAMEDDNGPKQIIVNEQHDLVCEKETIKSFSCYNCNYAACCKYHLINHMEQHKIQKNAYLHSSNYNLSICNRCNEGFKNKQDLAEHIIRKHPLFIASLSIKIHECIYCSYKTTIRDDFVCHMLVHPETANIHKFITCDKCDKKLKSKKSLDNHIIRWHPENVASVSNKILQCIHCTYQTTFHRNLNQHMLIHSKTTAYICTYCDAKFKFKAMLDKHVFRKHTDFVAPVSSRIHECTYCSYKTTSRRQLNKHMLNHSKTSDNICIHCDAKFKNKTMLDDHINRRHADFVACVSSRIHECTYCTYKTTFHNQFTKHIQKHSNTTDNICIHCNANFKHKAILDDHIITKHTDFVEPLSNRIHECTYCTYKTTSHIQLTKHMLTHSKALLRMCIHCNEKFTKKVMLDDHIIRMHPDYTSTITSKIYECKHCTYKSTLKSEFREHLQHHPETAESQKFRCIYCHGTFKSKQSLNNHKILKHSDVVTSVTSLLHTCVHCIYKTTHKANLAKHIFTQHEMGNCKSNMCTHCNKTYRNKQSLDDHLIKNHPDLFVLVSSKIYKCTLCAYKTTMKCSLPKHMLEHKGTMNNCKKYECTQCTYKTFDRITFAEHIKKHKLLVYMLNKC